MNLLPGKSRGFTVLELSLVVFLLAVLAVLLSSAVRMIAEHSRSAICTHRLRQIGVLYHAYLGENNGKSRLFAGGSGTMKEYGWYNVLMRKANYNSMEARKAFGCPSLDWRKVQEWYCYGFRMAGAPGGYNQLSDDGKVTVYCFNIVAIKEPSSFLMVADTLKDLTLERQSFRFLRTPDLVSKVHLRHGGRVNGLFLDGHIRLLDAADLYAAGVADAYDKDGVIVQTTP
ncbi:MAG TPA: prepilin-type N-terminal cleavage/methylation domain-containing protein [Chthoniobacteraceae bacterium]|nr:prepilin-type N-terminal cleavage/methylation domain-containing protein [Chthoniobacteraceae bacterium]